MQKLSPDLVLATLKNAGRPLSPKEIINTLELDAAGKVELKRVLKRLSKAGLVAGDKTLRLIERKNAMPEIAAIVVETITVDGEMVGRQLSRDNTPFGDALVVKTDEDKSVRQGDHALARLRVAKDGTVIARVFKILGRFKSRVVLGRVQSGKGGWKLTPVNRKVKDTYQLEVPANTKLENGMLVEALVQQGSRFKLPSAKLHAVVGDENDPKIISLISIHEQGLRVVFDEKVEAETAPMTVPPLGQRTDFRKLPLVTIDGADARDFDDAVHASQRADGGFDLTVAIADVSFYVRAHSALDVEAYKRGNSTYFPDRVVPMLPERLSNDLCSLRPNEDRACLVMQMHINADGILQQAKIHRGLMRSIARLTYDQVQAAIDGVTDALTDPLVEAVLKPLYTAYDVLLKARQKRGALDLDRPERQVVVDAEGNMTGVKLRARYDSHRLIEEFMVLANVAAAQLLEAKNSPCMYRVHPMPSNEKVESAKQMLEGFGLGLPAGHITKTSIFNHVLGQAQGHDYAPIVSDIILRAQSQAMYSPKNVGHFGLALERYGHFTSPIRRYADLVVHRALIAAYGLGDDGLVPDEAARLEETATHISQCERTSMEAERASIDRFTANFLEGRIGQTFSGRISGVTNFGLFVTLDDLGADGLVPMRSLGAEFFEHNEQQHALIGKRSGLVFRLCAPVQVKVTDASWLTGSTTFELVNPEKGADIPGFQAKKGKPFKKSLTDKPKWGKKPRQTDSNRVKDKRHGKR